jgi:hypothetical protein
MPTKTGQWVYMEDGSVAQQVYAANAADVNSVTPVDIQSRLASTIQTHSGAVVAPNTWATGATWIDCDGFDKVAINSMNDGSTDHNAEIAWSHDQSTIIGRDATVFTGTTPTITATQKEKSVEIGVKARYLKMNVKNNDGTNPHTISAWIMLKA